MVWVWVSVGVWMMEPLELANERLEAARLNNKAGFNKTHWFLPRKIEEGDFVIVYNSSLDNQHSLMRKLMRRWFCPYVVTTVHDNVTYNLAELDGTRLVVPIAGKRVKIFKKQYDNEPNVDDLIDDENEQATGHEVIEVEEMDSLPPSAHHSWQHTRGCAVWWG